MMSFLQKIKQKRFTFLLVAVLLVAVIFFCVIMRPLYDNQYCDEYFRSKLKCGSVKVKIHINVRMMEYHSLGKDLTYRHYYNGDNIKSGDIISVQDIMAIKTVITEHDASVDDIGESETSLFLLSSGGRKATTKITVYEDGGRQNSNAYAVFEVTYRLSPAVWKNLFSFS